MTTANTKADEWGEVLEDRAHQTISPDIVRRLLELNPALRKRGMTTSTGLGEVTKAHVSRAVSQQAKPAAESAQGAASADIVSSFRKMKAQLQANIAHVDQELARLKKAKEGMATAAGVQLTEWLLANDPDIRSPLTQSMLEKEKAFVQQVGFTVKAYLEQRMRQK